MKELNILVLLKALWASRKRVVVWGVGGAVVGLIIAFSTPAIYSSHIRVAPEGSSNSTKLSGSFGALASAFGGTTIAQDGITAEIYPQVIYSAPFLSELAGVEVNYNGAQITLFHYLIAEQKTAWWNHILGAPMSLYGWVRSLGASPGQQQENAIDIKRPTGKQQIFEAKLAKAIIAGQDKKSGIINIQVNMQDPVIAAQVADSVLVKLQRYILNYKTSKSRNDLEFSEALFAEARNNYRKALHAYATAIDQNQNLILQSAKSKIEMLANERTIAFNVYQQLATQVDMNRIKVQEDSPIVTVLQPARVALKPLSPNKLSYLIGYSLLAALLIMVRIVVIQIRLNDKNST